MLTRHSQRCVDADIFASFFVWCSSLATRRDVAETVSDPKSRTVLGENISEATTVGAQYIKKRVFLEWCQ